jgi:uncharacterized protein
MNMLNAINWFEIPVADLPRAMKFYGAMMNAELTLWDQAAPDEKMAMFPVDNESGVSGALLHSPRAQPSGEGTTVYLNVGPSIDTWLGRVEAAGGTIAVPKTALPPGMGFFAHIIDTEGNRVGLHGQA